jgi:hypothetical protein
VQSALLTIAVRLKLLSLRLHIMRCRFLVDTESNAAHRQQFVALLQALESSEMRLQAEYPHAFAGRSKSFRSVSRRKAALPDPCARQDHSQHRQSQTVIDFEARKRARAQRLLSRWTQVSQSDTTSCEPISI